MKLLEYEHFYLIKDFFNPSAIAGFTKSNLAGNLPDDFSRLPGLEYRGLAYLKQVHSAQIIFDAKLGFFEGDGLFTKESGVVLIVKTADCLPLFFASKELGIIGVVHMGWRSAKAGILDNITYDLKSFKVAAGVGLRPCCYQVGDDFLNHPPFKGFVKEKNNNFYFDPVSFAKENLCRRGLKESNFLDLGLCSLCSKDNFFSFRRNQASSRNLSFILKM